MPALPTEPGGYIRRLAALMRDAALALRAVHEQGIVHRDVKPGNLMLTPDGSRVVLLDFGLAKGQRATLSASRQGGLLGTLRYGAPEQLAAASVPVGPAADVRGLGTTFWEMLTRRRLFSEAADETQLSQQVLTADVPRLRQVERGLDRDLEAIVGRATERDLSRRIGSASRLAEYLQLYLEGKPLPIRPSGVRELAWRWVRGNKGLVASLAASLAALLLLGLLAAFWNGQRLQVSGYLTEVKYLEEGGKWTEARAVMGRAEDLVARGGLLQWAQPVRQVRADLEMATRLEQIPLARAPSGMGMRHDFGGSDAAYTAAFRDYDLDVANLEPTEAARRVRASALREPLVAALDDWIYVKSKLDDAASQLRAIARLADSDEERKAIRDALARNDPDELAWLAGQIDVTKLTPVTLPLLAKGLAEGEGDLQQRSKQADNGKPEDRTMVQRTLRHWQEDANLAGLRDTKGLLQLPEAE
jgi:hypothetical protein